MNKRQKKKDYKKRFDLKKIYSKSRYAEFINIGYAQFILSELAVLKQLSSSETHSS